LAPDSLDVYVVIQVWISVDFSQKLLPYFRDYCLTVLRIIANTCIKRTGHDKHQVHYMYCTENVDQYIEYINSLNTTWKAGKNFENGFRPVLGVLPRTTPMVSDAHPIYDTNIEIPESFDSLKQWSDCITIKQIRDQGCCGSCFAFGTTGMISDRICILSKGKQQVEVSAEEALACSIGGTCKYGGRPDEVYHYYIENGLVSGGPVGAKTGCQPYTINPGNPCVESAPTPECPKACIPGYNRTFTLDKHFGKSWHKVPVFYAELDIMTYGPIVAEFDVRINCQHGQIVYYLLDLILLRWEYSVYDNYCRLVYDDFYHYKSGVYDPLITAKFVGRHLAKVVGWGVENGARFWLAANSWGTVFGEQGYFKIKRGDSVAAFEEAMSAVLPKL
ncbi:unnamed protein product, partial [Oppiella nova]